MSDDGDEALDRDLAQLTSSPATARAIKDGLLRMSKNTAVPELAEMANELLAGRTSLRAIGGSDVYGAQLAEALDKYQRWEAGLTPEEREEMLRKTREHLGDVDPDH